MVQVMNMIVNSIKSLVTKVTNTANSGSKFSEQLGVYAPVFDLMLSYGSAFDATPKVIDNMVAFVAGKVALKKSVAFVVDQHGTLSFKDFDVVNSNMHLLTVAVLKDGTFVHAICALDPSNIRGYMNFINSDGRFVCVSSEALVSPRVVEAAKFLEDELKKDAELRAAQLNLVEWYNAYRS